MAKKDEEKVTDAVKIETVAQRHPSHAKLDSIVTKLDLWRISQDADLRKALEDLRATLPA